MCLVFFHHRWIALLLGCSLYMYIFFSYFHILFRCWHFHLYFSLLEQFIMNHERRARYKSITVWGSVGALTYNWNALNICRIRKYEQSREENAQIQFRKSDANEAVHHVLPVGSTLFFFLLLLFRFGEEDLAFFVAHECVLVSSIRIAYSRKRIKEQLIRKFEFAHCRKAISNCIIIFTNNLDQSRQLSRASPFGLLYSSWYVCMKCIYWCLCTKDGEKKSTGF